MPDTSRTGELAEDLLIDAEDGASGPPPPSPLPRWMLALAILVVACNLRPALTSVGPVLPEIRQALSGPPWLVALLTMLPVLCMGLAGPFAPAQARRWGAERVVLVWILVLAGGLLLRGLGPQVLLFLGTALVGVAIGIVGVLLPGLVKRDFRDHGPLMTGLFTMTLCWGAAFAAGTSIPLTGFLGNSWPMSLAVWCLPALFSALVWAPFVPRGDTAHGAPPPPVRGLWRHPLAWQVTLFMGLQSALAYTVFGWMAAILRDRGVDPALAGWLVSFSVVVQLPAALGAPVLAGRAANQKAAVVAVLGLTLAGLLAFLYAPLDGVWLYAVILGLGQGGAFAVALTLIVLRSGDGHVAAQLSSMVQGVGYTGAAFVPLSVGLLHDFLGSWAAIGPLFVLVASGALIFGLLAARPLVISNPDHPS